MATATIAVTGVRDAVASTPMRIKSVGAHQSGERDFARENPSGKVIANSTPRAMG
jgi:hypothetical protein